MFYLSSDRKALANLLLAVKQLVTQQEKMQMTLDDLKAKVDQSVAVQESAITLITGLAAQLRTIASDPAKIQALADELDAESTKLATAVTNNTPSAPAPTPPPAA